MSSYVDKRPKKVPKNFRIQETVLNKLVELASISSDDNAVKEAIGRTITSTDMIEALIQFVYAELQYDNPHHRFSVAEVFGITDE